ncbi:MAG TPA: NnrS family protein, partial [Methylomirabilota bacterium]|nr:NnrS family protein [Methylomirabilota bacterium]
RRLLTEGMVLLLVLGVGGFLGPRLLGFAQMPLIPIGAQGPARRSALYVAAGLGLVATLFVEYGADLPAMAWLRAAIASAVLLRTVTPWRAPAVRTTLAWCVWTAAWMVILGLWLAAVAPAHRIDFLHVLFMGGFTLLILAVGTRVTLSHGGHPLEAERRSWPLRIGIGTGLLALAARVGAGFTQESFFAHLAWASAFWIAGVAFWGGSLVRLILGPRRAPGRPA